MGGFYYLIVMKELIKKILSEYKAREKYKRWNEEEIKVEAKKYLKRNEFYKNSRGAYNAALRINKKNPGFFDEITQHMEPNRKNNWNFEIVLDIAKKYNSKTDFLKNEPLAYLAASHKGYLDQIYHLMKWERKKVWTRDEIEKIAKKYDTKGEFAKNERNAYIHAYNKKFLDDVTQHMVPVGNLVKRMVYAWEFPDKTVYVGLTGNKKMRAWNHINNPKSPVYSYRVLTGLNPKMVEVTSEYVNAADAQAEEEKTRLKYIENGWKVLNTAKTGGLGGNIVKWTKEEIENEAKKYLTRNQFYKNSPGAYNAAKKLGLFDEVTSHMYVSRTPWTYDMLEKEAKKYLTRNEFHKNSPAAYSAARLRGILDDITKHMEWLGGEKWDWDKILELTKTVKTYKELDSKFPGAANWVRNNNKKDELKKIIDFTGQPKRNYDSMH